MSFESTNLAKSAEKPEKSQAELRAALEVKLKSLKPTLEEGIKEYEQALADDVFADADGELAGTGEARKEARQRKLTVLFDQAEKIKSKLDSGEELPQEPVLDPDSLKLQNQPFLEETFKIWYGEAKSKVEQIPILVSPKDQDYATLKDDIDSTKYGEYTLNPDTQNLDFENIPEAKIFIPDLSSFVGKPLHEVAKHIVDTYSTTHHIPGIEYWKWLSENPTKSPAKLKDGKYYFNFGSLVRCSDGRWHVPCARWVGSGWKRDTDWLEGTWGSGYRGVLLEI